MKKISIVLGIAFLVFSLATPAFAAVQNVKVSGDTTIRNIFRSAYDLDHTSDGTTYNGGLYNNIVPGAATVGRADDTYNFFMQQVRLRVDAELTDNISGHVEILNQRDYDAPNTGIQGSALATNGAGTAVSGNTAGTTAPSGANDQFDVTLNKVSIEVKEFLYSPATLEIGRQDYQMGDGFIIGKDQVGQPDLQNTISADEFTQSHAFDSARLSLDLAPWAVDLFAAKISEDNIAGNDDENLFAINVGRTFEKYKSEVEAYIVISKNNSTADGATTLLVRHNNVYDFGVRTSLSPTDIVRVNAEAVMQYGREGGLSTQFAANPIGTADFTFNGNRMQKIRAFASDLRAEVDVTKVPWPTTLGIEHVFYSGEDPNEEGNSANYRPLYRGKFHSAIREFQGTFYMPTLGVTPGSTNQHQFILDAAFSPFNNPDIKFMARWLSFWFHHVPVGDVTAVASDNHGGRRRHIGEELDLNLTWDYTEDLTFGLLYAMFVPGSYFSDGTAISTFDRTSVPESADVAQELVSSVTLNFG